MLPLARFEPRSAKFGHICHIPTFARFGILDQRTQDVGHSPAAVAALTALHRRQPAPGFPLASKPDDRGRILVDGFCNIADLELATARERSDRNALANKK